MKDDFKIAGGDLGNDSLKLVLGPKQHYRLANAVKRQLPMLKRKSLDDTQKDILDDLDVKIESETINGRYFVGPLAVKSGEDKVQTGTAKSRNEVLAVPLITMLALDVTQDKTKQTYKLVAGLPVKEISNDREAFAAKLAGTYKVTFLSGQLEGRSVEVNIKEVSVIPEGVAVVINQMLNEEVTGFRDASLAKGQVGVIDIGAFTTDAPVVINGKPDSDASDGLPEGIANYLDQIVEWMNDEYRIRMTRSQLVVDHLEKNDLQIVVRGETVDITAMVKEVFEVFAKRIVAVVDDMWEKNYQITRFYVVGGGAKALREPLEAEMNKRGIKLTFIPDNEDPQMQNAMGYWKYGKQKFGAKK